MAVSSGSTVFALSSIVVFGAFPVTCVHGGFQVILCEIY